MIVIPQFTSASSNAATSAMQSDLKLVRDQLELYQAQHFGNYPQNFASVGTNATLWIAQLTSATDTSGNVMPAGGNAASYPCGPYLKAFPANALVTDPTAAASVQFGTSNPPCDGSSGWYLNTASGLFSNNDLSSAGGNGAANTTSNSASNTATGTSNTNVMRHVTPIQ